MTKLAIFKVSTTFNRNCWNNYENGLRLGKPSYEERLNKLNLTTLETGRLCGDLTEKVSIM